MFGKNSCPTKEEEVWKKRDRVILFITCVCVLLYISDDEICHK